MRDDDDGQVDGDVSTPPDWAAAGSPFARSSGEQPWLRGNLPPWHMWGNTQTFTIQNPDNSDTTISSVVPGQLTRVAYARPESWHWLFAARLIDGPVPGVGNTASLTILWDVTTGIGRSQQQLLGFDRFRWVWAGLQGAPRAHVMWATSSRTPPLDYRFNVVWEPDPASIRTVDQLVGQDIQLNLRLTWFMSGAPFGPVTFEVGGFFAPKTHVRPDWYRDGPAELQFGGSEVGGR